MKHNYGPLKEKRELYYYDHPDTNGDFCVSKKSATETKVE
jgi:hypothetical protein